MLTIKFVNIALESEKRGTYDVTVSLNEEVLANFTIKNHNRATGWKGLIGATARQLRTRVEGVKNATVEKPTSQLGLPA